MKENFNLNMTLELENESDSDSKMHIFPDRTSSVDLVGFSFTYNDRDIYLQEVGEDQNAEEYFHLDKYQVIFLIDYLKRMIEVMD